MDDIKKAASEAGEKLEEGLDQATASLKSGLAAAADVASQAYDQGYQAWDQSLSVFDKQLEWLKVKEQEALAVVSDGLAVASANPQISYPAAAGTLLLLVPGTRRMLYRWTIGRFRSPEAVVAAAESKLGGLGSKVEEFGREAQKLQARADAAEDEWRRGYQKLKSTRSELQRLAAQVIKSERQAESLVSDLRIYKRVPNALELRADAAQKAAALKQQRRALEKGVYRIAKLDI